MKSLKYLLSLLAGVAVYVLICGTCGRNGLWAMNQLLDQKREISANTQQIENLNEELNLEKTAIQNDKDVIAAYARKLDYVFEGEKLVKIKGLGSLLDMTYETGTVMKAKPVVFVPEWVCKAGGLLVGSLVAILMLLFDLNNGNISFKKNHYETVAGIPVYDVQQI